MIYLTLQNPTYSVKSKAMTMPFHYEEVTRTVIAFRCALHRDTIIRSNVESVMFLEKEKILDTAI